MAKMKVGIAAHVITTIDWKTGRYQKPIQEILDDAAEVGLQGIEFNYQGVDDYVSSNRLGEFKAMFSTRGLELCAFFVEGISLDHGEGGVELAVKSIIEAAKVLSTLGVHNLVVSTGGGRGIGHFGPGGDAVPNTEENYRIIANALNNAGKKCKDYGVYMSIHPPEVRGLGPKDLTTILDLTNPEYVYFNLDTGHIVRAGCNPLELTKRYVERIKYIHLKDFKEEDDQKPWRGFTELGTGTINHLNIFKVLHEANYDGWFIIEVPMASGRGLTPKESAKISLNYLKQILSLK